MTGPPWRAASRDATPALLAAYAGRFGRPFPPSLLPAGPLHPVGRGLCAWLCRAAFLEGAPVGYFVAGFAAPTLGHLRFYYMRATPGAT